jgi:hypothetical protein
MSQYFGHNIQFKYSIEVNQAALESYLNFLQIIVKEDFPNSDGYYAKSVPQ